MIRIQESPNDSVRKRQLAEIESKGEAHLERQDLETSIPLSDGLLTLNLRDVYTCSIINKLLSNDHKSTNCSSIERYRYDCWP